MCFADVRARLERMEYCAELVHQHTGGNSSGGSDGQSSVSASGNSGSNHTSGSSIMDESGGAAAFKDDLNLIWRNAKAYNAPSHAAARLAERMQKLSADLLDKLQASPQWQALLGMWVGGGSQ